MIMSSEAIADTCCDSILVEYGKDGNCCLWFRVYNPCSVGLHLKFEQYNQETGTWVEDARMMAMVGQFPTYHTMCPLPGKDYIEWRLVLMDQDYYTLHCGQGASSYIYPTIGPIDFSDCCDCPDDKDSWLTLEVDDDNPNCPDGCAIIPHLNIPEDITCYHYFLAGTEYSETEYRTPISQLGNQVFCVPKKTEATFDLWLYKYDDTLGTPCVLSKKADPCIETPAEPCVPDCEGDEDFTERRTNSFQLTMCNDCDVDVTYTWRYARCYPGVVYQDLQLLAVDFTDSACTATCDIEDIYENVLGAVIALNEMDFEPTGWVDSSETWRVANGGCWGKRILYYRVKDENGNITIKEVVRWFPCDSSECCLARLKVIRTGKYTVNVEVIDGIFNVSCHGDSVKGDDGEWYPCIPACHWAGELNGDYGPPVNVKMPAEWNRQRELFDYSVSVDNSNDQFFADIYSREGAKVEIKIFSMLGNELISERRDIGSGETRMMLDLSRLSSGAYLYSITIDGFNLNTGKFIITR